ncbi:MAG TPA: hypothetical protein VK533_01175 [Sphingomonas sp.]|uniref:hypothetical protein n=1 Tax=Sphingomonas sp. TaxID=28214 RepID=UPI002C8CE092|nr:hypothetical protein [Sphingomonas sp.]HMI18132.1 hypothetical protein [Sphingomonas sp.]
MLSIALFAAASVLPTPPKIAGAAAPVCQNARVEAAKARALARAQKLNQLPNANLMLGVLRSEDGCQKPVIVRYDIGSAPKR